MSTWAWVSSYPPGTVPAYVHAFPTKSTIFVVVFVILFGLALTSIDVSGHELNAQPRADAVASPNGVKSLTSSSLSSDWAVITPANAKRLVLRAALVGHTAAVWCLAFSSDGTMLASASKDMSVSLWDVRTGAARAALEGHQGGVNNVVFSPDGAMLASGAYDSTVRLWSVATGAPLAVLKDHKGAVQDLVFSPDGTTLASESYTLSSAIFLMDY